MYMDIQGLLIRTANGSWSLLPQRQFWFWQNLGCADRYYMELSWGHCSGLSKPHWGDSRFSSRHLYLELSNLMISHRVCYKIRPFGKMFLSSEMSTMHIFLPQIYLPEFGHCTTFFIICSNQRIISKYHIRQVLSDVPAVWRLTIHSENRNATGLCIFHTQNISLEKFKTLCR